MCGVLGADGLAQALVPTITPPQREGQLPFNLPHAVHQRRKGGARCRGGRGSHGSISLSEEGQKKTVKKIRPQRLVVEAKRREDYSNWVLK